MHRNSLAIIDLVDYKLFDMEEVLLSDISETIQMIPLETSDTVLIGNINSIKLEAEKLFIRTTQEVIVFDGSGSFLNTIGEKGRGPKEYLSLYDIFPENNMVWLIDGQGRKVLKFSNSGLFIDSFEIGYNLFTEFYYLGSDAFVGFIPDYGLSTDMMLAFFNPTGLVDSVLYNNPVEKNNNFFIRLYGGEAIFIHSDTQVKFKYVFNDTIYRIVDYTLIPDMVLNLGARKANENARAISIHRDPSTYDIYEGMDVVLLRGENERYIYFIVDGVPIFYDKKERRFHKWAFRLPEDERIDQEQAQKFIPKNIDKNGYLIGATSPANEEDNPVIVIAKLK